MVAGFTFPFNTNSDGIIGHVIVSDHAVQPLLIMLLPFSMHSTLSIPTACGFFRELSLRRPQVQFNFGWTLRYIGQGKKLYPPSRLQSLSSSLNTRQFSPVPLRVRLSLAEY